MSTTNQNFEQFETGTEGLKGPSGVSLKAAWILRQRLEGRVELPAVEEIARVLDENLSYEWAIRLLRTIGEEADLDSMYDDSMPDPRVVKFNHWAEENLLG